MRKPNIMYFINNLFSRRKVNTTTMKEVNVAKVPSLYEKHRMNDGVITKEMKLLIKRNKQLLLDNQISIKKIRFVFSPSFTYDIDKDIVNPEYEVMIPTDGRGIYMSSLPEISINKPKNFIRIIVKNFMTADNYELLKNVVESSRKGIVIFITDETITLFKDYGDIPYEFGVYTDVIRFADLDEHINEYLERNKQVNELLNS